jgi:uncharacterized protein YdaU (DUF1376 family)
MRGATVKEKLLAEWFWTDRWIGSSAALLPLEARGLYREMLTHAWRRGAKLPADLRLVQRIVMATDEEWARAWPLVRSYWRETEDGLLVNDTQLAVYSETWARRKSFVDRGVKGAEKRWGKNGRG